MKHSDQITALASSQIFFPPLNLRLTVKLLSTLVPYQTLHMLSLYVELLSACPAIVTSKPHIKSFLKKKVKKLLLDRLAGQYQPYKRKKNLSRGYMLLASKKCEDDTKLIEAKKKKKCWLPRQIRSGKFFVGRINVFRVADQKTPGVGASEVIDFSFCRKCLTEATKRRELIINWRSLRNRNEIETK